MKQIESGDQLLEYVKLHGYDADILIRTTAPGASFQEAPEYLNRQAFVGHEVNVVGSLVFACQWEDDKIEDDMFPLVWNGVTFRCMGDKVEIFENH